MQELVYVNSARGTKQGTGKPYSFIRLSDGIQAFFATLPHDLDVSSFKEGDRVLCRFTLKAGYKDDVQATLVEIKKAK